MSARRQQPPPPRREQEEQLRNEAGGDGGNNANTVVVSDDDDSSEEAGNDKKIMNRKTNASDSSSSPSKRAKLAAHHGKDDDVVNLKDFVSPHILGEEREATIKAEYASAEPYPHAVLEDVFRVDFVNRVLSEIKHNSKVNFKESDLFRVYQSIDLANLTVDEHGSIMPSVLELRTLLYSTEWRAYMERLCNLPPGTISDQVDCACNCHTAGCHLLCHDDVIGTRKISYILYLTEPDWTAEEGGALELYDSSPVQGQQQQQQKQQRGGPDEDGKEHIDEDKKKKPPPPDDDDDSGRQGRRRIPDAIPCKTVLPILNRMAIFVVEPGYSFHSVQEVFGDRPRLSLQGWYHADTVPNRIEHATLQRLKSRQKQSSTTAQEERKEEDTEGPFAPCVFYESPAKDDSSSAPPAAELLSADDKTFLAQYLDNAYLSEDSLASIRDRFEQDSSVQLRNFLNDSWTSKLERAMGEADNQLRSTAVHEESYYLQGVSGTWKLVGPSHKQRFLEYNCGGNTEDKSSTKKKPAPPSSSPVTGTNQRSSATAAAAAATAAGDEAAVGELLFRLRRELFESPQLGRLLARITSLGLPRSSRGRIRRFRPGLDYTVAHYGLLLQESVLDATLCFVEGNSHRNSSSDSNKDTVPGESSAKEHSDYRDARETSEGTSASATGPVQQGSENPRVAMADDLPEEDSNPDAIWQSGDCGGFECYIAADDDDDDGDGKQAAAAEYNQNDDTELLSVSASFNTLSLVYRDPGTMRFVKYVGSKAPSSRWDIAMEYQVKDDDNDDDNDKDNSDS